MIELTSEQRMAVSLDCPRLLVSASAGTGKTQVLTQRYLRLVLERQVEVGQIVAVTFTEAAAAEMRSRIGQALRSRLQSPGAGIQADWLRRQLLLLERAPICTLHSFCLRMVREFFFLLDLDPDFSVLDAAEAAVLKADALEDTLERWFEQCPDGVDDEAFHRLVDEYGGLLAGEHLSHLLLELDAFLNTLPDAQAWWDDVVSLHEKPDPLSAKTERLRLIWKTIPVEQQQEAIEELRQLAPLVRVLRALHAEFAETYWKRKLQRACVDFDDLEKLAWKLLREHPRIRDELQHRYRHILVDEYQDINPLQNAILEYLHGNDPHNQWFMVGDVKQSIYGFRLACPALFQEKVLRYLRVSPSLESSSPAQYDLPQLSDKDPARHTCSVDQEFPEPTYRSRYDQRPSLSRSLPVVPLVCNTMNRSSCTMRRNTTNQLANRATKNRFRFTLCPAQPKSRMNPRGTRRQQIRGECGSGWKTRLRLRLTLFASGLVSVSFGMWKSDNFAPRSFATSLF
jgi:ATP-dependent exoDNAse (exonuclease V) beta subunit